MILQEKRHKINRLIVLFSIVFWLINVITVLADPEIYSRVDYVNWKELESDGNTTIHKSGPNFMVGAKYITNNGIKNTVKLEAFTGMQTNTELNTSPIKNQYFGFAYDSDWGKPVSEGEIEPFIGVGVKYWRNSFDSSTGTAYDNYIDNWSTLYSKIGIRQSWNSNYYEVGIKYPLVNYYKMNSAGDSLSSSNNIGFYIEFGKMTAANNVSLFYEYQPYFMSDSTGGIDSREQTVGLKVIF